MTVDLGDSSTWTFSPTEEQVRRVRDAYVTHQATYGVPPDHDILRSCIALGFLGDVDELVAFWEGMATDMPGRSKLRGTARTQIEALWYQRKLEHIVRSLDLDPLESWESKSVVACLRAPDNLRGVADALEKLIAEGWELTAEGGELDQDGLIFTWNLRRKNGARS